MITVHDLPEPQDGLPDGQVAHLLADVRVAVKRGALVHVPSEAVRQQVIEQADAEASRVVVIHHGPPHARGSANAIRPFDFPYLLAIGTAEPRKRLTLLATAFEAIATQYPDLHLVIAGSLRLHKEGAASLTNMATHSPFSNRIHILGYVPDDRREQLLAHAELLAIPSAYEGFGMTVLEGYESNTPVLAAAVGGLPETAGQGALLIRIADVEDLASGLSHVLDDSNTRSRLVRRGRIELERFDWERTAQEMSGLYNRVAK